jgi:hypothetical protein
MPPAAMTAIAIRTFTTSRMRRTVAIVAPVW